MKKQNKIIAVSLILTIILVGTIFVTGADEIIVNTFTKTSSIDKVYKDFLLTKVPEVSKGEKEIKPNIIITCNEDYCKWSAVQEGLIHSYDNLIKKQYCINLTNRTCLEYGVYTNAEIETLVSQKVSNMLINYANKSIDSSNNTYTKISEGSLEVTAK